MVPLTGEIAAIEQHLLAEQVQRLGSVVAQAREGSVELMFARHVLGDLAPPRAAESGTDEPESQSDVVRIASYGYATLLGGAQPATPPQVEICDNIRRLSQLDPFPSDGIGFLSDPVLMIGTSAAVARAAQSTAWDCRGWLVGLLEDQRCGNLPFQVVARAYALHLLSGNVSALPRLADLTDAPELGFSAWMSMQNAGEFTDRRESCAQASAEFLAQLLITDTSSLTVPRAAITYAALAAVLRSSSRRLVMSIDEVSAILRTFPACMERWRWDPPDAKNPVRWFIDAEREVQDILWIMLRSHFNDLVYEDPLPKVGHSSYRPDFGIPGLRLLIEVKYVRRAIEFKDIEKQVMEDSVGYLANSDRYERITVFIYDDSSSSEHHDTTRRDLTALSGIADVVIVSRPGRIPPRDRRTLRE